MNTLKTAGKVFDRIIDACQWFIGAYMLFVMLSVTGGVLSRYIFNRAIGWTTEISYYLLIPLAFLAAPKLARDGGHIIVDLVLRLVSQRVGRVFCIVTSFVGSAMLFVMTGFALHITWTMYASHYLTDTFLMFPKWVLLSVTTLGLLLTAVQFARNGVLFWKNEKEVCHGSTEE